jgi:aldehyde dehydrogenase (NAD+)
LKFVQRNFAPVLYLLKYSGTVENALELQNGVAQGLSSAIMTNNLREAEHFLSVGSDCGIECKHGTSVLK